MNPCSLKAHVDRAIERSNNKNINKLRAVSANQLKSGDLSIKTATTADMEALRQFAGEWEHRIGNHATFDRNTEHIAVGDYNLHHELWGGINIRKPDPQASELIELMDNYDLASQLPAGTMTYEEGEKCLTTIDLTDRIIRCEIDDEVNRDSDHLPIVACHTGNVT
ncbi:hypothetical protein FPOAC2_13283 [Fusarium poae]